MWWTHILYNSPNISSTDSQPSAWRGTFHMRGCIARQTEARWMNIPDISTNIGRTIFSYKMIYPLKHTSSDYWTIWKQMWIQDPYSYNKTVSRDENHSVELNYGVTMSTVSRVNNICHNVECSSSLDQRILVYASSEYQCPIWNQHEKMVNKFTSRRTTWFISSFALLEHLYWGFSTVGKLEWTCGVACILSET